MDVIHCNDCPATSEEAFIHVDEELCLDCRDVRAAESD